MKHFLLATLLLISFTADLAPRCQMIRSAHADLAPAPDEPCYQKKAGEACVEKGEKGVCETVCYERVIDEKRHYKSCSQHCKVKAEKNN